MHAQTVQIFKPPTRLPGRERTTPEDIYEWSDAREAEYSLFESKLEAALEKLGKRKDVAATWARDMLKKELKALRAVLKGRRSIEVERKAYWEAVLTVRSFQLPDPTKDEVAFIRAKAEKEILRARVGKAFEAFADVARESQLPPLRSFELHNGYAKSIRGADTKHLRKICGEILSFTGIGYYNGCFDHALGQRGTPESKFVFDVADEGDTSDDPIAALAFTIRWDLWASARGLPTSGIDHTAAVAELVELGAVARGYR